MTVRTPLFAALMCATALPALASDYDDVISGEVRPGWRLPSGEHIAALHLRLAPGWKTYWRSPGEGGIPPQFNWSGSSNLEGVEISWPAPEVFLQSGMYSVGYATEVVLPLRIRTKGHGKVQLRAEMDMGLCKDICMPYQIRFRAELPSEVGRPDPVIAASLASVPFTRSEAGVRDVDCNLSLGPDGVSLTAQLRMPSAGGDEFVVVETPNPMVWVQEAAAERRGSTLVARTDMMHMDGKPFVVDRSSLRITVIGKKHTVEVTGCD